MASAGAKVVVFTSVPSQIDQSLKITDSRISIKRVWAPKPILDRVVRLIKPHSIRHSFQERTTKPSDRKRFDVFERFKRHYGALEHIVDRNKLWSFLVLVTGSLHRISNQFDIIISSGPPMSIHISAMLLSRLYGCKWIMDMRDPWDYKHSVQWSRKIGHWFERQCILRADTVVLTSPGTEEQIKSLIPGVKTRTIMNGYDWTLCSMPMTEKLSILYTGTLYYNRDPFPFLRAYARLCTSETVDREFLKLVFVGDCEAWMGMSLSRWVTTNKLESQISIRPPVPKRELMELINDSCVLLIFAQGQPKQIPGKTFEAIGSRRTLFVLTEDESDTASVVRGSESGIVVPGHDENAIYLELEKLYGLFLNDRGALRRILAQGYSRQYRNQDYQLLITSVLERDREADTAPS